MLSHPQGHKLNSHIHATIKFYTAGTTSLLAAHKVHLYKFKVCKSVHHRTIQIAHQPDATIFQFIILTFIYISTCFGRSPAHHQELNDCSGSLWFYLRTVVIPVFVVGPAGPTTNTAWLSPQYEAKTRGCYCNR
jgi:hypothetical protein